MRRASLCIEDAEIFSPLHSRREGGFDRPVHRRSRTLIWSPGRARGPEMISREVHEMTVDPIEKSRVLVVLALYRLADIPTR